MPGLRDCRTLTLRRRTWRTLHWIDSKTQAFLDSLVESLPTSHILLLVNYRPEYRHAWGNKSAYLQVRLDPLPPDRVEDLLRWILGNDPGLQSLRALLIERTEGNPFFLEESVRTLIETRALAGERGAYRVAKPVEDVQIPATVQAVLAARIDRLPPDEKWLLQAAAVIGKDVPHRVLHAVVNRADEDLRREVAHLLAAEFLYETQLFPDLEYTFKHALSHDVAYEGLLQGQRRNLHAGVVAAFERLYPDRLGEQVERLAEHAVRGEVWPKALVYQRQAADQAIGRGAAREARAVLEHAISLIPHLPDDVSSRALAIDLRLEVAGATLSPRRG